MKIDGKIQNLNTGFDVFIRYYNNMNPKLYATRTGTHRREKWGEKNHLCTLIRALIIRGERRLSIFNKNNSHSELQQTSTDDVDIPRWPNRTDVSRGDYFYFWKAYTRRAIILLLLCNPRRFVTRRNKRKDRSLQVQHF